MSEYVKLDGMIPADGVCISKGQYERLVQAEAKLEKAEKVARSAIRYIDESPCDPDIYPEQIKAYAEYQQALQDYRKE